MNDLIKNLQKEGAKKPLTKPIFSILSSCLIMVIYFAILLYLFGIRDDFLAKINQVKFQLEIAFLTLCSLLSCACLNLLRLPDFSERKLVKYPYIFFFLSFLGIIIYEIITQNNHLPILCGADGKSCLISILLLSLFPLILTIKILKNGVITNFIFSSLAIGICSGSLSYLLLRMSHKTENIMHLVIWHLLPIILVIFCSGFLVRFFTKKL